MRFGPFIMVVVALLFVSSSMMVPAKHIEFSQATRSDDSSAIIQMIQQINESMLYSYHHGLMKFGPRYTGTASCNLAAQYLYDTFQTMGLPVEFYEWKYGGFQSKDVVATLQGTDGGSTAQYILCGHYDTVKVAPGADDDGSGTAAVLAIASVLSKYQFNHTIKFICFSGEEVGTYGSFTYAREASYRGDNIIAVLNMDMIGYANTMEGGRTLRFFPPLRARWIADFATTIAEKYNDLLDMKVATYPSYPGDDSQSFDDYGYDGVWIAHQDGYPYGHSANDTADHLNWTYYTKATKLMLAVTAEIAQRPIDVEVMLRKPLEGYLYLFKRPILQTSFGKQWFDGLRGKTFIIGGRTIATAEVESSEPIQYVIFCVDGQFLVWDSQPPYEWQIQGWFYPLLGKHTIEAYAYTTSGKVASDEMDIFILSLSTTWKKP
ncbi:MAG TPA: M28 family metallopeptidase [Candidatus Thermoplasmatota archaeon]|nr:M28 family metallopeptidase [Candidatus Thermoplasmatota archaeon]